MLIEHASERSSRVIKDASTERVRWDEVYCKALKRSWLCFIAFSNRCFPDSLNVPEMAFLSTLLTFQCKEKRTLEMANSKGSISLFFENFTIGIKEGMDS